MASSGGEEAPKRSRRQAIRALAGATVAGGTIAALFIGAESWVANPSLALLATRHALIALLRTRAHQLAVVAGSPDDEVRDDSRRLLSSVRRHVDVMLLSDTVADPDAWVALVRARQQLTLHSAGETEAELDMASSPIAMTFDQGCTVAIRHGFALEHPRIEVPWLVSVQRGATHVAIASSLDAVKFQATPAPFTVLAAPNGTISSILETSGATVLTSSAEVFAPDRNRSADGGRVMPIYPATPTIVEMKDDGADIRTGIFG